MGGNSHYFFNLVATTCQDISYSVRTLLSNPYYTCVTLVTLALAIAANTAIFSLVNATLLRPLPFKDPERLVLIWQTNPGVMETAPTSFPNYTDWKSEARSFEGMEAWASYTNTKFNLTGGTEPEQIQYALASANLFSILGIDPVLGRFFRPEDDSLGGNRVVVISNKLWQRRFALDPKVIGASLTLDGDSYTIVGVLPSKFKFVSFPKEADVWIPLAQDSARYKRYVRSILYLGVIARLKNDMTTEMAATEMLNISSRLSQEYSDNKGWATRVVPLKQQVVGDLRPALLVLVAAVVCVLLIACSNVANILLSRAVERQKEIAIRAAIGATRGRLIRQLLTESVLLALLSGGIGLVLAIWAIKFLSSIHSDSTSMFSPYSVSGDQINLDFLVFGFTLLLSVFTGVTFGLVPAIQASKLNQFQTLKDGGRGGGGSSNRSLRNLLVIAEVAISLILLISAGLLIKSFARLQDVDPGFNPENVLTLEISLSRSRYPQEVNVTNFYDRLLGQLRNLPGVQTVGAITALPLSKNDERTDFYIEGRTIPTQGDAPLLHQRKISPNYIRAMGMKLLSGREYTEQDRTGSPRVVIINQTMARQQWPKENPIGKRMAMGTEVYKTGKFDLSSNWAEIVGVVSDVRHFGLDSEPGPEAYLPLLQSPARDVTIVIRALSDPASIANMARREVLSIDKDQPIANIRTMATLLSDSLSRRQFNSVILTIFAIVALTMAVVGIYGLTSYSVTQRTHEFGVRMALGASPGNLLKLVLKEGLKLVLIGAGIGVLCATTLTRFLSSMLYGVSSTDPLVFASVTLLLIAVVLTASYFPARRAMLTDPIVALRNE